MELRTALEALTPITSQRFLDTFPVLRHIELYADSDGYLTGALATDRYVVALVGTHDDPAAYIDPVQAKQLLAHLKAHKNSMIPPMINREAGTILGIPVTMPDDLPTKLFSAQAEIIPTRRKYHDAFRFHPFAFRLSHLAPQPLSPGPRARACHSGAHALCPVR